MPQPTGFENYTTTELQEYVGDKLLLAATSPNADTDPNFTPAMADQVNGMSEELQRRGVR